MRPPAPSAQTVSMGGSLGSNALLVIDGKARNVAVGSDRRRRQAAQRQRATRRSSRCRASASRCSSAARRSTSAARPATAPASRSCSRRRAAATSSPPARSTAGGALRRRHRRDRRRDRRGRGRAHRPRLQERAGAAYSSTANGVDRRPTGSRWPRCGSATSRSTTSTRPSCRRRCRYVLLGNSYLTRFQMRRENDLLTLDMRY